MDSDEVLPAFTDAPDEKESLRLTQLGRELYEVDKAIADAEALIKLKTVRKIELTMKELPDYLKSIHQDKIGLPEFEVDLVLENYYHANIKADWPPEKREEAFKYLEEIGSGDLIKTEVVFLFGRKDLKKVRWLQAFIETLKHYLTQVGGEPADIPEPTVGMAVPWNTLTAWVKEQLEGGLAVDLDKVGATVGQVVKIKPRKK